MNESEQADESAIAAAAAADHEDDNNAIVLGLLKSAVGIETDDLSARIAQYLEWIGEMVDVEPRIASELGGRLHDLLKARYNLTKGEGSG